MADLFPPPVEEKFRAAAQAVQPECGFSEGLLRQILESPVRSPRKSALATFFTRPVWVMSAALGALLLVIVVLNPQRVAAAFETLIGYIPGIGFVQNDGGTLYLEKPITVVQDGVSLIIEQAVADADKTVIAYRIEGLPVGKTGETTNCVYDINQLQPLGGVRRPPIGGGISNNVARIEFFPLPSGVERATLHIALSDFASGCTWPAEWNVDIPFGSKPSSVNPMPVLEGSPAQNPTQVEAAPFLTPSPQIMTGTGFPPAGESVQEVEFSIDRVVEFPDGTLLVGHTNWKNENWENVQAQFDSIQVLDAQGKSLPLAYAEEGSKDNQFAFKISGGPREGSLKIKIQAVHVWGMPKESPPFSFDAGPEPAVGQDWKLDQAIEVLGHKIVIHSIRAVHDPTTAGSADRPNGYAVEFEADAGVDNLDLELVSGVPPGNGWSQERKLENGHLLLETYYLGGLPKGTITYKIRNIFYRLDGPWQFEWQLPASQE